MRIKCGNCGEIYDLYSDLGGGLFTCQTCGALLQLPPSDGKDINDLKLCPHCGKLTDADAVCPHCGELLLDLGNGTSRESGRRLRTYRMLALFLGGWGIHNFYAGRRTAACIQLVLGLSLLTLPLSILWSWCELCTVTEDGIGQTMQ